MSRSESRKSGPHRPSGLPKASPRQISEAAEAAAVHRRKTEASPKREDFEREFGKHRVKDEPDGSWTFNAKSRREIRRSYEMMSEVRKIDVERGEQLHARHHYEKAVNAKGKVVPVRSDQVDIVKKGGLRPIGRNGTSSALYFGMAGLGERWERGKDGMNFFWDGGWEPRPEGRCWPSPQRDPAGNVWVNAPQYEGDDLTWVLEDEVG